MNSSFAAMALMRNAYEAALRDPSDAVAQAAFSLRTKRNSIRSLTHSTSRALPTRVLMGTH